MTAPDSTASDLAVDATGLPHLSDPSVRRAEVEVSEHAIRTWCGALNERNPLFLDPDVARAAGFRDVIAPPAMLQTWTMPLGANEGPPTVHAQVRRRCADAGLTAVVATNYVHTYIAPIYPGDDLTEHAWVENISPLKRTKLGVGRFVTIAFEISDDNGVPRGTLQATTFYFDPGTAAPVTDIGSGPPVTVAAPAGDSVLDGDDVMLDRSLVIAGSLASNDHERVHHDHEIAHAQGLDDIILSIVTTAGLVNRYVGARLGPATVFRELSLRLAQPAYPGDVLALRGTAQSTVTGPVVDVVGSHRRGVHVTARVRLESR